MTPTGGWDKVVIESLAAGCPVFASNQALKAVFGEHAPKFLFEYNNPLDLASKIEGFIADANGRVAVSSLKDLVVERYDFKNLIRNLVVKI
jgi:glycosyltransferase involved in cell wall biosynthesis